jgi:hypothetical protein
MVIEICSRRESVTDDVMRTQGKNKKKIKKREALLGFDCESYSCASVFSFSKAFMACLHLSSSHLLLSL